MSSPAAALNLILLGPPGAGKGTQADLLQEDFKLPYVSTGDVLRKAVKEGTDLGREAQGHMKAGDLVPDEVVNGIIRDWLASDAARDGFLFDGFPRTIAQAEFLDETLEELGRPLSGVVCLEVADEVLVERIAGRAAEGGRDDDEAETVRNRLGVYHAQTKPLQGYYEQRGLLARIDGERTPDEVHDHIRATVATWRLEAEA